MDPFPLYPPKAWLTPPADMPRGRDISIVTDGEEAGRAYGYVCPFNTCILTAATLGRRTDQCFTAPHSPTNYEHAHQGHTVTLEGETVRTANIGGGINHYREGNYLAAVDHYANTASQLLRGRYGEDDFGIWFAGAAWPEITERQVAEIRASALSGDWRWRPDLRPAAYDMAGSQLVSNPGFPMLVQKIAASASQTEPPPLVGGWGGDFTERKVASAMDGHECTCGPKPVLASLTDDDKKDIVERLFDKMNASLDERFARLEEGVTQALVNT